MPTNFVQWNPSATNQQNDTAYATSASAGAATNSIFASTVANKLFYQVTTFVTAFATTLSNLGFTVTDASLANLESVLSQIVISGIGASPTLGNVTCNAVNAGSLQTTTSVLAGQNVLAQGQIQGYGNPGLSLPALALGNTSGVAGTSTVSDGTAYHNGYTGTLTIGGTTYNVRAGIITVS